MLSINQINVVGCTVYLENAYISSLNFVTSDFKRRIWYHFNVECCNDGRHIFVKIQSG